MVSAVVAIALLAVACTNSLVDMEYGAGSVQPRSLTSLVNPGFESGLSGWNALSGDTLAATSSGVHSGSAAAKLADASRSLAQTVNGLLPGTTYTLKAWMKNGGKLGVMSYGGSTLESPVVTSGTYAQYSLSFTTGAGSTSAVIYGKGSAVTGYFDDVSLEGPDLSPSSSPATVVKYGLTATQVKASTWDSAGGWTPDKVVDGNLSTRWAGEGDGAWIDCSLGGNRMVSLVKIAFYNGASRTFTFDVQTSLDGVNYTTRSSGLRNAANNDLQTFDIPDASASNVRIVGHTNTVNAWNSYQEVEVWVVQDGNSPAPSASPVASLSPSSTPSPLPSPVVTRPPTSSYQTAPSGFVYYHDVVVGTGGSRPIKIEICAPDPASPPAQALPVIAYIHGGGWNSGSKNDGASKTVSYAKRGYVGVSLDYRLTSESGNPIMPAQIEDIKLAIRYLRANAALFFLNPNQIALWGSSAGSHLAALAGTSAGQAQLEGSGGYAGISSAVCAVVDWSGPVDFTDPQLDSNSSVIALLGGKPSVYPSRALAAMPSSYADAADPPFLILHGDADTTVPYSQSVYLKNALLAAGVDTTFSLIPGGPHSLTGKKLSNGIDVTDFSYQFLDFYLKGVGTKPIAP